MFAITSQLRSLMEQRLTTLPVNARMLLLAGDVGYEETSCLGEGVASTLRFSQKRGFTLMIAQQLKSMERNQVEAHALAHLMLHSEKFQDGDVHADMYTLNTNPYQNSDPLTAEDNTAANRLALEILIPTIPLREAFLYFEGRTQEIAQHFGVPTAIAHRALVQRKLMDARSSA